MGQDVRRPAYYPIPVLVWRAIEIRPKLCQAALDEAAFRCLRRQSERAFVCGDRFVCAPQTTAKVGPCGVREVVAREFAAGEDRVDEREADFGAIAHGDGGRTIEFHDGRRLDAQKYIIESNNLAPIGRGGGGRLGVHGGDGGLQRVRPESPR